MGLSATRSEADEALADFTAKNFVLELLFAENLTTLLSSPNQVGHHLLGRAVGHILEHLEAFGGQLTSHLIGEASELSKAHARVQLEVSVFR